MLAAWRMRKSLFVRIGSWAIGGSDQMEGISVSDNGSKIPRITLYSLFVGKA